MNKTELIAVLVPIILLARVFVLKDVRSQISGAIFVILTTMTLISRFVSNAETISYVVITIILIGMIALLNLENSTEHEND